MAYTLRLVALGLLALLAAGPHSALGDATSYADAANATQAAAPAAAQQQEAAQASEKTEGYAFCSGVRLQYKQPPRGVPPPPLGTAGNRLINRLNGQSVAIRGINWFGFNVGMSMVDGLWAGGHEAATDFGLIVYQLKMMGFNAVRLPFRWLDLDAPATSQTKDCSPVNVDWLTRRLISPNLAGRYAGLQLPGNVAPLKNNQRGYCNTYVPNTNVYERLLWVTQVFISQGMYVVLDYQPMGTETQAYDVNKFVSRWEKLWRMLACTPNFNSDIAGRVFIDPINEPDSMQISWEPTGGRPGARQLYLGLADRLWALTPKAMLFMFEGSGQQALGLNWGNGFTTDPAIIASRGISDPNPFFKSLLKKPYNGSVVMTPHVYPPTITRATFLGKELWKQCNTAFGYLQAQGYCQGSGKARWCRQFPVVIGETGSAFETSSDKQWLSDFADYLNAQGGAAAFNRQPVNGWMWWAYNENSGDTGGIVKNQWQDLDWEKLNYLIARMGLRPWYLRPNTQVKRTQ